MSAGYQGGDIWTLAEMGNGCRGKVGHTSKRQALGALRILIRDTGSTTLNAYKCRACKRWHLGNRRPR